MLFILKGKTKVIIYLLMRGSSVNVKMEANIVSLISITKIIGQEDKLIEALKPKNNNTLP